MEVAGQWRREWAGTAEYGKVTEGGVTRRIARAMEVLHASAPGARVRVVRAAYHSSAGPGAPAASCLMHSSRRVISSGFNVPILESPSFPSKPLEISSTPFESSPESNIETENYKVTEPDDFDISEPSKWKPIGGRSIRMPSEESSSTDNASIIDLDSRVNHRNNFRKYSYDSENSDVPTTRKNIARVSPLLDAPVALSTLKYKSLLNNSNDWNVRRKSYSFEDTSPLNETVVHSNDTLAMESSTDSGICKSSELVNDTDDKYCDGKERKYEKPEENFKDWLSKNRSNTFYKRNHIKSYREHDVVHEHPFENSIALQSKGKVSITVPITVEVDNDYQYKKNQTSDDNDRKVKKVEFCKTELHFAVDSGKVNIIATDEKPPPTNDFRKRKSAFVPIRENFEKPVTLFGENKKDFPEVGVSEFPTFTNTEIGDSDENTAATKSILKNKIPKPKPYLLGENMVFGCSDVLSNKKENLNFESTVPTAVTLINRQLQSKKRYSDEKEHKLSNDTDKSNNEDNVFRTTSNGPSTTDSLKLSNHNYEKFNEENSTSRHSRDTRQSRYNTVKAKLQNWQMSPVQVRAKTRQLRDSDLTYFGIDKQPNNDNEIRPTYENRFQLDRSGMEDFRSIKLIQKVSNSVCNSEAESDDAPEYQNIPIKTSFTPVPTPRTRSQFDNKQNAKSLNPVIEQDNEINDPVFDSRRSRFRRQDEIVKPSSRSISEPPQINRNHLTERTSRRHHIRPHVEEDSPSPRLTRNYATETNDEVAVNSVKSTSNTIKILPEDINPLYMNYAVRNKNAQSTTQNADSNRRRAEQRKSPKPETNTNKTHQHKSENITSNRNRNSDDKHNSKDRIKKERPHKEYDKDSLEKKQRSIKRNNPQRTQKLATPEYTSDERKVNDKLPRTHKASNEKIDEQIISSKPKSEHRSRSSQRHSASTNTRHETSVAEILNNFENAKDLKQPIVEHKDNENKDKHMRTSSKDKTSGRKVSKTQQLLDTNSTDSHHKSIKSRVRESKAIDKVPKTESTERNKYVINYDDKNGTVSSICKVKLGPGTSKRKKIFKETTDDSPNEYKVKNKAPEKISLRK